MRPGLLREMPRQRLHFFFREVADDALHGFIGAPAGLVVLQLHIEEIVVLAGDDRRVRLPRHAGLAVTALAERELFGNVDILRSGRDDAEAGECECETESKHVRAGDDGVSKIGGAADRPPLRAVWISDPPSLAERERDDVVAPLVVELGVAA